MPSRRRDELERSSTRPPILRSIRTRLAVTFFLVTFLSVAVIYVVVAPPLTSGVQNESVTHLHYLVEKSYTSFRSIYKDLAKLPSDLKSGKASQHAAATAQRLARTLSGATGLSQVMVVDVISGATSSSTPQPAPIAASPDTQTGSSENQRLAVFAAGMPVGAVPPDDVHQILGSFGVVGVSLSKSSPETKVNHVIVFAVTLGDVSSVVSLVRSRILLAAALGLLVALLTGVLVARALTVRVLRLESVAQRVAQGDFEAHFSDSSGDELGQLAAALAHMQSQLEGLENSRRRFIATASHELRTPIFSLGGFLELIQDETLDEETRQQFLSHVREQVDRLGKLATQLLDLTRLETGSIELASAPTDIGVLARTVGAEFAPALAQHHSRLVLRIPEQPIRILCDSERVAQLLRILIDNALAHTPPGTDMVVAASPPANATGAQLAVHDGGPGIPPEAIGRVFEPFYSADGARGAGLGLAIAHELAARMEATLDVTSTPGSTTFTLTLSSEQG
jgi:two-component system OmpR family sensor kinase